MHAALYCDKIMPCADYYSVPDNLRLNYELLQPTYRQLASEYLRPGLSEWEAFVDTIRTPTEEFDEETAWVVDDAVMAAAAALAWQNVDCMTFTSRGHDFEGDDRLLTPEYYEDRRDWWVREGRHRGSPNHRYSHLRLSTMQSRSSSSTWKSLIPALHCGSKS